RDFDTTEFVGDVGEGLEVGDHHVVDTDSGQIFHGLDHQGGATVGVGGIDLLVPVPGDRNPRVPGDGHHRDRVPVAGDGGDHDGGRALGSELPGTGVAGGDAAR